MRDEFDSPEEAALSGWTPVMLATVIETRYLSDDVALVLIDTSPSHPMLVTCERQDGKWAWTMDQTFNNPWPDA